MKNTFPGFPQEALKFLRDLKKNNNRDWFLANKQTYENQVRAPMVTLLTAMEPEIRKFAPEINVDPKRNIFRIYRDIRFSQDKSPYKTHIAAYLEPDKKPSCGLYLHLDAEQYFLGGGVYHPGSPELLAIRNHVASDYRKLLKVITSSEFKKLFGTLEGEQLSRVPRGFAADHPAADLLRRKQFLAFVKLPAKVAITPAVVNETVRYFKAMMPLVRFLNEALRKTGHTRWM